MSKPISTAFVISNFQNWSKTGEVKKHQ